MIAIADQPASIKPGDTINGRRVLPPPIATVTLRTIDGREIVRCIDDLTQRPNDVDFPLEGGGIVRQGKRFDSDIEEFVTDLICMLPYCWKDTAMPKMKRAENVLVACG